MEHQARPDPVAGPPALHTLWFGGLSKRFGFGGGQEASLQVQRQVIQRAVDVLRPEIR
jgi:hypothetical protein